MFPKLNQDQWCIYASINNDTIGSDKGMSPVWCQAIILISDGLLFMTLEIAWSTPPLLGGWAAVRSPLPP